MELEEFISETLSQIVRGIERAREETGRHATIGAQVQILPPGDNTGVGVMPMKGSNGGVAHLVKFDVALTASDGVEAKAKLGVVSGLLNTGGEAKKDWLNSTVSRVQFTIPIAMPKKSRLARQVIQIKCLVLYFRITVNIRAFICIILN